MCEGLINGGWGVRGEGGNQYVVCVLYDINLYKGINHHHNRMVKNTCKQCGHQWNSRVDNPNSCPKCKRYDWKTLTMSGANLIK